MRRTKVRIAISISLLFDWQIEPIRTPGKPCTGRFNIDAVFRDSVSCNGAGKIVGDFGYKTGMVFT